MGTKATDRFQLMCLSWLSVKFLAASVTVSVATYCYSTFSCYTVGPVEELCTSHTVTLFM